MQREVIVDSSRARGVSRGSGCARLLANALPDPSLAARALLLAVAALLALRPPPALALDKNFVLLSRLDAYSGYNDVWGYRDPATGREYAILGTETGTSIVNVTDPFAPYETGFIPGVQSIWRDMHTYQGRAYIVSEGPDAGLQIVSLADPEAPVLVRTKDAFTAHTIWIDEATGVAYLNGASGGGTGFRAYNLAASPDDPPFLMNYGSPYIHDLWAGGGIAYTADIYSGGRMRILDVSALPASTTITQIGSASYPSGATHNTWPHGDGVHVFTTDERTGGTVRVWDVSDPQAIVEVAQFAALPLTSVHNVYVKGDTAYCSWYSAGIRAFDVTDPTNPVNIGRYDTHPGNGGLVGCWSVYPYLPSGVIPCADMSEGLVLVAHVPGVGRIAGTVTRAESGAPLDSAIVRVPGFYDRRVPTDSLGAYAFDLPAGSHAVIVTFPGCFPDTAVVAIADTTTTAHDVALVSQATGVAAGEASPDGASVGAGTAAPPAVPGPSPAAVLSLRVAGANPTRGGAAFVLSLPEAAPVRADLFDASGRAVRTIASGALPGGPSALAWDGRDASGRRAAPGIYILRVESPAGARAAKLTLVR